MLKLQQETFQRAAAKAASVRPTVRHDGAAYFVIGGDGLTWHAVRFIARDGSIWARCTCRAGRGVGRRGESQPCYHVAAAVLFGRSTAGASAPAPARQPVAHLHACPGCSEEYHCQVPACAYIDDLQCNTCEAAELRDLARWQ